ncbi:MAG: hypothetical protein ACR2NP_03750 [Pirellulaceae bacterium]
MLRRIYLPLFLAATMALIWTSDAQAQSHGRYPAVQTANTCQNCGQQQHRRAHPRGRGLFHKLFYATPDFTHDVERDGSWRFTPQPYDRALYPKYIGGFHASQIQNAGVPHGDIGFRGNGVYWTPW